MTDQKQTEKRKNSGITIETKLKIISDVEKGGKVTEIAQKYHVHHSTVSRIISNKDKILQNHDNLNKICGNEKRMRYTGIEETPLEKCLFTWFTQKRSLGESITGPKLKEKALFFHKRLNDEKPFAASDGWLSSFKERHGIRKLNLKGEKLSADTEGANHFKLVFNQFLHEQGYHPDNIYNADETGLMYKSLPQHTLAARNELEACGRKIMMQRLTVMVCANSTGTHKIPLLVIGSSMKPRCFTNISKLPVEYRAQKNAWMDRPIFTDWYTNIFLPSAKEKHLGKNEKLILLLDNAPTHPPLQELNALDEQCYVFYLPPNVTSLIQPMDQGVTSSLKRRYKELFLRELLNADLINTASITKFISSWNVLNCCDTLYISWENVSKNTLANAWKNLLDTPNGINEETAGNELIQLMNKLPRTVRYTGEDCNYWVNVDNSIPSCRYLCDNEIVNKYGGCHLETSQDDDVQGNLNEDYTEVSPISTSDAIDAITKVSTWCKMQKDFDTSTEDYKMLLNLRQRILIKKYSLETTEQ